MQIMTHLVANYPNPESFEQALLAMFEARVDFLEIQLPFSNPLADGPIIYEANQIALKYEQSLSQILENVSKIRKELKIKTDKKIKTKLLLMSYLTPILVLGMEKIVNLCLEFGFVGFIIPDLVFGSVEQKTLSKLCQNHKMQLIPVVSPLTKLERLEKIKLELENGQIIYAMARAGRTGSVTNLCEIQPYLDFLKQNLANFQIAIGFGIKEKSQVKFLNEQNLIAVIGSQIIREIQKVENQVENQGNKIQTYNQISTFLTSLE